MRTSMPNFNFLASLVTEIRRGSQNKKVGAADLPRRPLADKFLYGAIVPANAYQQTKFQLSSSISLLDMRGSQNKKWELLNHTPLANNWELLISAYAPQRTNFYMQPQYLQMPASIPNFNFRSYGLKGLKLRGSNFRRGRAGIQQTEIRHVAGYSRVSFFKNFVSRGSQGFVGLQGLQFIKRGIHCRETICA